MDYELYHDESLEFGYWHGMLLVPTDKKREFYEWLIRARETTGYSVKLGIKKVERPGKIFRCASAWAQISLSCLRSNTKGRVVPVCLGRDKKGKPSLAFVNSSGMKFILLREREAHHDLTGYPDYGSKVETTFRFGIKGGMHFLGSEENTINVTKIHFDGHQHYRRKVDRDRIVNRLYNLRGYCSVSVRSDLIDDRHSDHEKPGSQEEDDCQFLQLTDILIGCFRTAYGYKTKDIHVELALPVKKLIVDEYTKGYARMSNSRWRNSFMLSQCYLEDGKWKFEPIGRNPSEGIQLPML